MHAQQHPDAPVVQQKRAYKPMGRPLKVLQSLRRHPRQGPKRLGDELGVPTSHVGPILTALQRRQCIQKQARGRYVLTERGEELLETPGSEDSES